MASSKSILSNKITHTLIVLILRWYRSFVFGTLLFRHDRALHALLRTREPAIFAVWHQDFVYTIAYLSRFNVRRKTFPLASASRDGSLVSAVAVGMGFRRAVRGSSARGGHTALRQLTRILETDKTASVAVVCDGPRPPACVLKPGILHLAQTSGLPIWLVRTSYSKTKVLTKTWAEFHIPLPLSRAVCLADGPIHVSPDLDRAGLEAVRLDLESRLNDLATRADALVAKP
jgi:3-deoxy-D-manno-octulosonic-acid transferase